MEPFTKTILAVTSTNFYSNFKGAGRRRDSNHKDVTWSRCRHKQRTRNNTVYLYVSKEISLNVYKKFFLMFHLFLKNPEGAVKVKLRT